jgi:hypothetical protein
LEREWSNSTERATQPVDGLWNGMGIPGRHEREMDVGGRHQPDVMRAEVVRVPHKILCHIRRDLHANEDAWLSLLGGGPFGRLLDCHHGKLGLRQKCAGPACALADAID